MTKKQANSWFRCVFLPTKKVDFLLIFGKFLVKKPRIPCLEDNFALFKFVEICIFTLENTVFIDGRNHQLLTPEFSGNFAVLHRYTRYYLKNSNFGKQSFHWTHTKLEVTKLWWKLRRPSPPQAGYRDLGKIVHTRVHKSVIPDTEFEKWGKTKNTNFAIFSSARSRPRFWGSKWMFSSVKMLISSIVKKVKFLFFGNFAGHKFCTICKFV